MSKDFKEKYERVCAVKDRAISLVEAQMNGNIDNVDAKELGEVADIAKDFAEIMKCCAEAEYYHTITESMEKSSEEDKKHYMDKYLPETQMYYTPMGNYARQRDSRGRYMYTEPYMLMEDRHEPEWDRARMYYSSSTGSNSGHNGSSLNYSGMNYERDNREGRSGITRRTYLDMKDSEKSEKLKKFKEYINNFQEDMEEMFIEGKSTPEEKAYAKQALAQFISKL